MHNMITLLKQEDYIETLLLFLLRYGKEIITMLKVVRFWGNLQDEIYLPAVTRSKLLYIASVKRENFENPPPC